MTAVSDGVCRTVTGAGVGVLGVLGAGAAAVRAVRVLLDDEERERGRVPARDPWRAVHEPAVPGLLARARLTVREREAQVPRGEPRARRRDKSDAFVQSGRRPRAVHGDQQARREDAARARRDALASQERVCLYYVLICSCLIHVQIFMNYTVTEVLRFEFFQIKSGL